MKKKFFYKNDSLKRILLSALMVIAVIAILVGVTMAWLTYQYRMSTICKIHPPTYISILEPGDTAMQSIDLSYDKSEVKNGKVELKRPIVIRSESEKYDLCIAHTTNISGLAISLYKASADGSEGNAYLAGITEKGTPYYWNKVNEESLFNKQGYLNISPEAVDVIWANKVHQAHKETFRLAEGVSYNNVQKNAEPLYWVAKGLTGQKRTPDDGNYYTNYILEITWDETDKETDILYVIAQTNNETSSGSNQSE